MAANINGIRDSLVSTWALGSPVAAVTCTHCRYIRLHAILALEP